MFRLLTAVLIGTAASPVWALTHLLVDAEQSARIQLVISEPRGGFSVFLTDGSIAHFDQNAQLADVEVLPGPRNPSSSLVQYPGRWRGTADASGNFRILIDDLTGPFLPDPALGMDVGSSCTVDKLAGGRGLTRFSLTHSGGAYRVSPTTDGDGGNWMFFHTGHLVRFAADCRADMVAVTDLAVIEMAADPTDRAVYFLTSDRKLNRLAVDGFNWTLDLSSDVHGWSPMWGLLTASERGDVVLSYTQTGSFQPVLVLYDSTGNLQWSRPLGAEVWNMAARNDSILVISSYEVLLFDAYGDLVWQDSGPGQSGVRGINAIIPSPNGMSSWIEFNPDGDPDILPVMRFDTVTGAADSWLPEWDLRPVYGMADGSLLFVRVSTERFWNQDGGHALYVGRPNGGLVSVPLPPDMAADRIMATRSDNHGTVSVVEHDGGWTLFAHDAQLHLKWRRRQSDRAPSIHATYQLATSQEQVCMLVHEPVWGKGASRAWLSCHQRNNGQQFFEPLEWHAREAVMRADIGDSVDIVFYDETAGTKLRRILVDPSGGVSEPPSRFIPRPDGTERIEGVWFQPDGSLLIRWTPDTLHFIPADPELPILTHMLSSVAPSAGFGPDPRTLAFGHDRYARLAFGFDPDRTDQNSSLIELRMFTAAGKPLHVPGSWPPSHWEIPLELGSWHQQLVTATQEGWLIAILAGEHLYVQTLSKDGETNSTPSIVRINVESNDVEILRSRGLLAWDGKRLVIAIPNASATRVQWFDPASGTVTAAASMHMLPQYHQLPGLRGDGTLVVAGELLGPGARRPALWQAGEHARRPRPQSDIRHFSGAWYDRPMSGQGFFIDSIGPLNQLFGAWFTFSQGGGHQPGELVWYTLFGDGPAIDGVADLTIYRNRGGRFEQPPTTTAEAVGHARVWQTNGGALQASFAFDPDVENEFVFAHELHRVLPVSTAPGVRNWYDPAISGQGLLLAQPLEADGDLFGGWFTYDPAGLADDPYAQHWFVVQGGSEREHPSGLRRASIYRVMGGRLGVQGTSNVQVVGEVVLRPISCDRLEFAYRFDSSDLAGPFGGLSGRRELRAIIGCP